MQQNRRNFLKGAGAVGAVAATGGLNIKAANAARRPARQHGRGMAQGLILVTLRRHGAYHLGVLTNKGVLDVVDASHRLHMHAPATMDDLLQHEDGPSLNSLVDAALRSPAARPAFIPESAVEYGPVVTRPEKIVCVGLNYKRHAHEVHMPIPKEPVLFNKFNNSLSPHNGVIKLPTDIARKFDYETELVIVMGRQAKNVSEADALKYVAGYCTGNDFTARDLQLETGGQWMVGKTCDQFGVLGPYLHTADGIDPDNLKIETFVNGQQRQHSNTNDFIFNSRQMISYISRHMTLQPGDIIYTGTPEGVILGYPKDKQVWLKPGDKVVSRIEKLGELHFQLA